jgi:putative protease
MVELLAPAGSFESLTAAIQAGADAIYFGVGNLNMRSRAANFTEKDLAKVVQICKKSTVNCYLTLNTVVYDTELEKIHSLISLAKKAGVSAVIASDIAVINACKKLHMPVHISTQANVSNIEAVKFYSQYADVIVLARELTLEQITGICTQIKKQRIYGPSGKLVAIEIFVHGALCVSISGKCYMSLALYNSSANRGACYQPCRRMYTVKDTETDAELSIDNNYIMSPKDLCTITFLDTILKSGVSVLKIEGRGRAPEYVATVVRAYKEAIQNIEHKTFTQTKVKQWLAQLQTVYNRGFWQGGYYLGKKLEEWSGCEGSQATMEKVYCGVVENYFSKKQVACIHVDAEQICLKNTLLLIGPTSGVVTITVDKMIFNEKEVDSAVKGQCITIPVSQKVRKNDKVYIFRKKST